jgi:hypothetical protein
LMDSDIHVFTIEFAFWYYTFKRPISWMLFHKLQLLK